MLGPGIIFICYLFLGGPIFGCYDYAGPEGPALPQETSASDATFDYTDFRLFVSLRVTSRYSSQPVSGTQFAGSCDAVARGPSCYLLSPISVSTSPTSPNRTKNFKLHVINFVTCCQPPRTWEHLVWLPQAIVKSGFRRTQGHLLALSGRFEG